MQKIMVTGASGFAGQHLVKELRTNGAFVVGVGKSPNSLGYGCDLFINVDLMDAAAVKEKLDLKSIDGVIHLAGLAAVGDSFKRPLDFINVNAGLQINLIETALSQKVSPRFIIISSGSIYDLGGSLPLSEKSRLLPGSPYAVSKMTQENLAHYYESRGIECVIVRPFNHIGPGQGPGFIVPDLADQIVKAKKANTNVINVGNLNAKRDYTDVRDIARAYRLLLEKGRSGEIYNVCSGRPISGQQILDGLAKAVGIKVRTQLDESKNRPVDNPVVYGDYAKLEKETGWKPKIKLEQTLADVIASM